MPGWWSEVVTLLHTFGFWFALTAICLGIIIQYLIRPYFSKVSGGFHKVVTYTTSQYEASKHPTRIGDNGKIELITRQEMLNEMGELKGLLLQILKFEDSHFEELNSTISNKFCTEACPVYQRIFALTLETSAEGKELVDKLLRFQNEHNKEYRETLSKLIEARRQTSEEVSDLHRRLDTFLDTSLATIMAAVEKRVSDKQNGGSHGLKK
jgi:hypothetical protein